MSNKYKHLAEDILGLAGVQINGNNPWDIQIHNSEFYRRAITEAEVGIGESYMDEWWDVEKMDEFIHRIFLARADERIQRKLSVFFQLLTVKLFNLQSKRRAYQIAERHYDLGNNLFQNMLDSRMNYSCAYWKDAQTLDEAQENKLELICRKLYLESGMRVLDIGCGWGAFGKFAAEKYGVEVVGITVSKEQVELGRELCDGLPVEFRLMDYRDLDEKFDRIVSIGMIEHVGYKNYRSFFRVVNKSLTDTGLFILHTIGRNKSRKTLDPWINKYIFPNGMLPSIAHLGRAIEDFFVMEDWHNFGPDYDKTLMAWHDNFVRNWNTIAECYSERFFRMWNYYLLTSAASFRARNNQLWQIVLSKNGTVGGYQSVR